MGRTASALTSLLLGLSAACSNSTPPANGPDPAPLPSAPNATRTPESTTDAGATPTTGSAQIKTLFVHEARVDCEGVAPMKCLQVRESEQDEWTYFYSEIVGFDYEESYRYELRVEIEEIPNPPMDASSKRYRLLEIVSKQRVGE